MRYGFIQKDAVEDEFERPWLEQVRDHSGEKSEVCQDKLSPINAGWRSCRLLLRPSIQCLQKNETGFASLNKRLLCHIERRAKMLLRFYQYSPEGFTLAQADLYKIKAYTEACTRLQEFGLP
jgi:hypothetical protein